MAREFFPNPAFAWIFCVALGLLTCVAAWTDTRTAKIPNRLNVAIFALGLVMNVIRGAWMGAVNKPLWLFETGNVWLGAVDGFLFALLGFVVAFAVMVTIWIFGLCGGGDVKLLSAVAVWIGFDANLLRIWVASVAVLFVWTIARLVRHGFSPRRLKRTMATMRSPDDKRPSGLRAIRVTYSLPIAVATIVVLLWVFRFELLLTTPKPQPQPDLPQGALAHVRPTLELV